MQKTYFFGYLWAWMVLCAPFARTLGLEIHGHRGARGVQPENTLRAFQHALDAGADVIEFDVQPTKDGLPLVLHNPYVSSRLYRDTSHKFPAIADQPLWEGMQLRSIASGVAYVPSLAQVFQWAKATAPQTPLSIEMKMNASPAPLAHDFAKQILKLASAFGITDRLIIQSFDPGALDAIRSLDPKVSRTLLAFEGNDFCERATHLNVNAVSPHQSLIRANSISPCKANRIKVIPYTVNNISQWERLTSLNVDGIITDFPARLFAWRSKKLKKQ